MYTFLRKRTWWAHNEHLFHSLFITTPLENKSEKTPTDRSCTGWGLRRKHRQPCLTGSKVKNSFETLVCRQHAPCKNSWGAVEGKEDNSYNFPSHQFTSQSMSEKVIKLFFSFKKNQSWFQMCAAEQRAWHEQRELSSLSEFTGGRFVLFDMDAPRGSKNQSSSSRNIHIL